MDAVLITGPGSVEVRQMPTPELLPGHCLIRVAYVGICGTDAALYRGDSVYIQQGRTTYPIVFGHEWSGTVIEVGAGVIGFEVGDRVAGHNFITCGTCAMCRTGRQNLCPNRAEAGVLDGHPGAASQFTLLPAGVISKVPPTISLREAACLEPGTCVMHGLARARLREDDRVAVIGTGTLGLIAVQIAVAAGAEVDAIGIEDAGLELACTLGARRTFRPEEAPRSAYTLAIEVSGAPTSYALLPRLLAPGGRGVYVGVAHTPVDDFPAAETVLKNLELYCALGGLQHWERFIKLVSSRPVDLRPLIHSVVAYRDAAQAFRLLLDAGRQKPKVMIDFAEEGVGRGDLQ